MHCYKATDANGDVAKIGHAVHATVPLLSLYWPASHATHGPCVRQIPSPPRGPVYPMLHEQLVTLLDPHREKAWSGQMVQVFSAISPTSVEYLPPAHFMHADDPLTNLYVPEMHGTHAKPSGPV